MNRSEANEKARQQISNAGFGSGTNITVHALKCMMVDFYLDNQNKNFGTPNISDLLVAWEQFRKDNWWDSESVDVEKVLIDKFQVIYGGQGDVVQRVMHSLLPELNQLDTDENHKDWYCATIHHRLTEAKRQDGNLAVAICNALEDYLK